MEECGPLIVNTAGIYSAGQNKVNRYCTVPGKKKTKQLGHARAKGEVTETCYKGIGGSCRGGEISSGVRLMAVLG